MPHWVEKYLTFEYGVGPGQRQCWQLVQDVYRNELNIKLDDFKAFSENDFADAMRVSRTFKQELLKWERVGTPGEFDVAVMAGYTTDHEKLVRAPLHAGIVVGNDRILHIERGMNATCVLMTHWSVKFRIIAFGRHELVSTGCLVV